MLTTCKRLSQTPFSPEKQSTDGQIRTLPARFRHLSGHFIQHVFVTCPRTCLPTAAQEKRISSHPGATSWLLGPILLFGAFLAAPSWAQDKWDKWDYALGAATLTATVIDWGQTRYVAKHPNQYFERNPLLGEHPTVNEVNRHFITSIAIGSVVAYYLPSRERKIFLGGMAVLEIAVTQHNKHIGVRMEF